MALAFLVTGGAGFVGSSIIRRLRQDHPTARIVAFDNLRRRGSELNLQEFKSLNIEFVHGDLRIREDLFQIEGSFDVFIDACAEPSVHAGQTGTPDYVLQTNLFSTLNVLEFVRQRAKLMIFLSTSRVYSIPALQGLKIESTGDRFVAPEFKNGIDENFPILKGARSFYGSSKLASELLIQEYAATYGLKAWINRCGVIAGPGQFGKVDQGVFTLWVAHHYFKKSLGYKGFGGHGHQVRDLLHPDDLYTLLKIQILQSTKADATPYNVGGGVGGSTSLLEFTKICETLTGNKIEMHRKPETDPVDVPWYVTDNSLATKTFEWKPQRTPKEIAIDIYSWLNQNGKDFNSMLFGV